MSEMSDFNQNEYLKELLKESSNRTHIITVTSGKGGVGKSNFALNLAIVLSNFSTVHRAQATRRVTLMDADFGLANINVLLGIIPKFNLYHVLKGQKSLQEIIIPTSFGVDLIAGASGLSQVANLAYEERINLIQALLALKYADFLIIDTAAGLTNNVTQFASIAHETIVVTTPEPTAITDAYGIIKAIALDYPNPTIKLVINRAESQKEAERVASKIVSITQQFLNVCIEPVGFIPSSSIVPEAVRKQTPFCVLHPSANVSQNVQQIARKILNVQPENTNYPMKGWRNIVDYIIGN